MSSHYRSDGRLQAVTVIKVDSNVVTGIKTIDRDGYAAVQVGAGARKRAGKSLKGQLKDIAVPKTIREFRPKAGQKLPEIIRGASVDLTQFAVGDLVNVVGISKGRGFQGVVKRHGFHGSPKTHGHKDQLRMPGSIGSTAPQRVFKGMRMAGRMGGARVSVKHLEVIAINPESAELILKGAVPGAARSLVLVQSAS